MAESPYHPMWVQHIRLQDQCHSQAHPVVMVHQLPTPGAHNPWAAEAALEAHIQQGLERRRLDLLK